MLKQAVTVNTTAVTATMRCGVYSYPGFNERGFPYPGPHQWLQTMGTGWGRKHTPGVIVEI